MRAAGAEVLLGCVHRPALVDGEHTVHPRHHRSTRALVGEGVRAALSAPAKARAELSCEKLIVAEAGGVPRLGAAAKCVERVLPAPALWQTPVTPLLDH